MNEKIRDYEFLLQSASHPSIPYIDVTGFPKFASVAAYLIDKFTGPSKILHLVTSTFCDRVHHPYMDGLQICGLVVSQVLDSHVDLTGYEWILIWRSPGLNVFLRVPGPTALRTISSYFLCAPGHLHQVSGHTPTHMIHPLHRAILAPGDLPGDLTR